MSATARGNGQAPHWRDLLVAGAGLTLLGGLYLDGWAHVHVGGLETFFTPWHGVLYSGFALLAASVCWPALLGLRRGEGWRAATPAGYGAAMLGAALFAAGGLLDMGWHTLFGVEASTEALLSPPHLLLAAGGGLMLTAPLRAAWAHDDAPRRWATWLPPLLSAALLLGLIAFFTSYAHPFTQTSATLVQRPFGGREEAGRVNMTISGMIIQAGVQSGLVLLMLRRWPAPWPFGSLTLAHALALAPLTLMYDRQLSTGPLPLIAVALLGGLLGDALLAALRPSAGRPAAARLFAAALPAGLYALYLAAIALGYGTWWSAHLLSGAVTLAAATGWLVSYLVFPPDPGA